MPDGLVADRIGVLDSAHLEGDERPWNAALLLPDERIAADELALVEVHEMAEPGLEDGVLASEILAPHTIGFLDAQRIHGPHPALADAQLGAGLHEPLEDVALVLDGVMQLPAELADEVHTHGTHGREPHVDMLRSQPGEAIVG